MISPFLAFLAVSYTFISMYDPSNFRFLTIKSTLLNPGELCSIQARGQ